MSKPISAKTYLRTAERLIDGRVYPLAALALFGAHLKLLVNPKPALAEKYAQIHERYSLSATIDHFNSAKHAAELQLTSVALDEYEEALRCSRSSGLILPSFYSVAEQGEKAQLYWHYPLTENELAALNTESSYSSEAEQLRAIESAKNSKPIEPCPLDCELCDLLD